MAQTKQQIQSHLAAIGTQPRHRFGQNFMIDQNLVRLIADAAAVDASDTVIEVGPGTGTLTEELLSRAGRVIAVEIDRDLAGHLRSHFGDRQNFTLIEGDALDGKHAINPELKQQIAGVASAKLVANLPYNIASPLIIDLLIEGVQQLVFTVQKEVADRLKGSPDSDDYGPLTVMVQMLSAVEVLRTLPPQAFWPPPKIDSSLVRLVRRDRLGDQARAFGQFVQKLFSFRRKTLRPQAKCSRARASTARGAPRSSRPSRSSRCFSGRAICGIRLVRRSCEALRESAARVSANGRHAEAARQQHENRDAHVQPLRRAVVLLELLRRDGGVGVAREVDDRRREQRVARHRDEGRPEQAGEHRLLGARAGVHPPGDGARDRDDAERDLVRLEYAEQHRPHLPAEGVVVLEDGDQRHEQRRQPAEPERDRQRDDIREGGSHAGEYRARSPLRHDLGRQHRSRPIG
jgi:16S rRNA (adenine1518-N6/adenine1519-N6)-dimethyltransferase